MTTVAISQSNYLPWRGYFSQIKSVDSFVFLDNVQFTKRDWRTRNQILTPQGLTWINIPITPPASRGTNINEISIPSFEFLKSHLELIRRSYSKAAYYEQEWDWVAEALNSSQSSNLSEFNTNLIKIFSTKFAFKTQFHNASDFRNSTDPTKRLLGICIELGATRYLSGPSAKNYLDESEFNDNGIEVIWAKYNFPQYSQLWNNDFQPNVSIVDMIFNAGFSELLLDSEGNV